MGNPSDNQLRGVPADERASLYRRCVTEKTALQQARITESLQALMQGRPFSEITVTQLCQHAGVTRRTFYYLFSNITGALYALIDRKILAVEICGKDELPEFFQYWKDQEAFLAILEKNGMSGLLLERMIVRVLQEDYDVQNWLQSRGWRHNSRDLIVFGLTGLMGLVYSWYYSGFARRPEELADLVKGLMMPN